MSDERLRTHFGDYLIGGSRPSRQRAIRFAQHGD
jgi:hypothetical protein